MMRVIEKIRESSRFFEQAGIEEPMREAEMLIRHAFDIDSLKIYRDNPLIGKQEEDTLEEMLRRRAGHEPLQYITGYVDFLGLRIVVGRGVLIPRPETEIMAEEAIKRITHHASRITVLDLCTGSGCIALSLAKEFPAAYVYGSDISEVVIGYAKKSALINRINNVRFITGDLFKPFSKRRPFDIIISNPPYIRTDDIKDLQPEIKEWEPLMAIDGGEDGLRYYRRIIPDACHYLKDRGLLIMEICPDGANSIVEMLKESGYSHLKVLRDYAGMERIVMARQGRLRHSDSPDSLRRRGG
jgi:release factor glutamine methyltransferase